MELDSDQIRLILSRDPSLHFYDVLAYDQLPRNVTTPISLVINNENSNEKGGHWTALVIDETGVGSYFCSLGTQPYGEIAKLLVKNSTRAYYNKNLIQDPTNDMCGYHCIYFIVSLMKRKSLGDVVDEYSQNLVKNDRDVYRWVQSYVKSL